MSRLTVVMKRDGSDGYVLLEVPESTGARAYANELAAEHGFAIMEVSAADWDEVRRDPS